MKSKIIMVCMILGLSAAVNTSYAVDGVEPGYKDVINSYIDGYMNSDYKQLDIALSDEASIKTPRAETVLIHSKGNVLAQMKKNKGTHQNCNSKFAILDKSDAMIIAKVDFKYNDFTQHNYLVLEKNEDKQWKITQVCKFFEDVKPNTWSAPEITANK